MKWNFGNLPKSHLPNEIENAYGNVNNVNAWIYTLAWVTLYSRDPKVQIYE